MPKGILPRKNFKRFSPANNKMLLLFQGVTFGIYNARLKLKEQGYKFRNTDLMPVLVVGTFEVNREGCKVTDVANTLGYKNAVAQKILTRCTYRRMLYKVGGKKGRGNVAKYYLTDLGFKVYEMLKNEVTPSLNEVKRTIVKEIYLSKIN